VKNLCSNCIGEPYLKDLIYKKSELITCYHCGEEAEGCSLGDLAEIIDVAFDKHYVASSTEPNDWDLYKIRHTNYEWEPDGAEVTSAITEAAMIAEEIAADIREILADKHYDHSYAELGEPNEYEKDSYYEKKGASDEKWQTEWNRFKMSIKTNTRFFNKEGAKHLSSVFDGIEHMKTINDRQVIRDIGPGTDISFLYRARVFQSDEKLKSALCYPDLQLGPPPTEFAPSGRMNAKGISVFYGATETKTALAEVRPPVGSKVTIAKFELLRPLRMLDLTALSYMHFDGSIFDDAYSRLVSKNMFLKGFGERLSRPVMPDEQDFEYLPTQAIADFLSSESDLNLDGIIFSSAQSDLGLNAVLFHKASRIKLIKRSKETTVSASLLGWDDFQGQSVEDYRVTETIPFSEKEEPITAVDEFIATYLTDEYENRDFTLNIDVNSITVEYIKKVEVDSSSSSVLRNVNKETSQDEFKNLFNSI